jgi:stearoyl-CoA desaturase (delta-9 desaturase)
MDRPLSSDLESSEAKLPFNWVNFIFLTATPLAAFIAVPWYLYYNDMTASEFVVLFFFFATTGLGITMGYHRLFSHKTYEANTFVKFGLLVFGAMGIQNSALLWSADHRRHHQFTDTDQDPYNAKRGFWFSHILWILWDSPDRLNHSNAKDLFQDPLVMWQHRNYVMIAIVGNVVLLTLCGLLIGNVLGVFVMSGLLRIVLNHHFTFFINSFAHITGTQPYSQKDTSRDNFFLALVTYGEGYHNFHHRFPNDYRNGVRWYQFDPSKWAILAFEKIGWTSKLNRTPFEFILREKVKQHKFGVETLWTRFQEKDPKTFEKIASTLHAIKIKMDHAEIKIHEALAQLQKLRESVGNKKTASASLQYTSAERTSFKTHENIFRKTRKNAEKAYEEWQRLTQQISSVVPSALTV